MKKLLVVLLESFVLTIFFTLVSQAYVNTNPSPNCRKGSSIFKKCEKLSGTVRGSVR